MVEDKILTKPAPPRLVANVYYAAKPGQERRYCSPNPYSPEFAKVLKADGYKIFRLDFLLPQDWDSADDVIPATRFIADDS